MLDYLITNAEVYDGLQVEPQFTSVGIQGDRIVHIGDTPTGAAARETVDGYGKILCPGFIDIRGASGIGMLVSGSAVPSISQGITSVVLGAAGQTAAPIGPEARATMESRMERLGGKLVWEGMGQWLDCLATLQRPINIGTLVGHATIRDGLSADSRQVSGVEIAAMGVAVNQACAEGAFGLATSLNEPPTSFASTEEVIELGRPVAQRNRILSIRLRDERQDLDTALGEAVHIAQQTRTRCLVSRLQVAEKPNWGRLTDAIFRLEDARAQGLEIFFAVCPYPTVNAPLRSCLPKPALVEGIEGLQARLRVPEWQRYCVEWLAYRGTDFDDLRLLGDGPGHFRGSVAEIAAERGVTPAQLVLQLIHADPEVRVLETRLSKDDVEAAVLSHESMVTTGAWLEPIDLARHHADPHPAAAAAFARLIEQFAVSGLLHFGKVISKITSAPADLLGLADRGRIADGAHADLVLFDPAEMRDTATLDDPRSLATGVEKVWVNGRLAYADQQVADQGAGQVLRPGS